MSFDLILAAELLALLGGIQVLCSLLARGLGRRLPWRVMALGWALPLLLLFPWLDRTRILVPADPLQGLIPGAPPVAASHRHDLLNDAIHCLLPWELEVRHALKAGRLPLWSDSLEGGSSPWINPQAQPLSPIAMATRAIPIQYHLLAALALKILVAFEGAWLLGRMAGLSRRSSLLAAAGFALSGGILAWSLFPHSTVAAWVPWLAAATLRLFRDGRLRTVAIAALATGILLLSGQPETAAAGGLFAAVVGLGLRRRRLPFASTFAKAAMAGLLGFALAAPQLLPFGLHLPESARFAETAATELPAYHAFLEVPLSWFLPGFGKYMLAPVSPRAYGLPFAGPFSGPFNWAESECGYAGLLAFAFSAAALGMGGGRRRLWPFLGFGLVCLLLAARPIPLAELLHQIAPLRAIAWSRFLLVGCLGLAIAGGMGLDLLWSKWTRPWRRTLGLAALALAAGFSLYIHFDPFVFGLWLLLLAAVGAGLVTRQWSAGRSWAFSGLALVLLLDLISWGRLFLPSADPALFYPRTDFIAALAAEAAAPGGPFRATGELGILFPSLLPVYGIDEVRPHNPLTSVAYLRTLEAAFGFAPSMRNYFPTFGNLDHPFLDFLNVRVVAAPFDSPPPATLERVDDGRFGYHRIYRNPDALPRYFVAEGADPVAPEGIAAYIAAMGNPRRVAVPGAREAAFVGSGAVVAASSPRPGRVRLELDGRGDRLLATSLRQPEGWRATGDGRALETLLVDGAFLGVHVPPGVRRVELRFRPRGFGAGLVLSLAALLATIALYRRA